MPTACLLLTSTGILPTLRGVKTSQPLLVDFAEAEFQLTLPEPDIRKLIRDGEILAVDIYGETRIVYESLAAFARRAKRRNRVGLKD